MLNRYRGLAPTPDRIGLTCGSQMAIVGAARVLVSARDLVFPVEELCCLPTREAFPAAGATVVPIGLDAARLGFASLDSAELAEAVRRLPHVADVRVPSTLDTTIAATQLVARPTEAQARRIGAPRESDGLAKY